MIKIGIIGAGPNGTGNAKNLAEHNSRCRIAVVADPNLDAATTLAAAHGAQAVADFRAMLGDVDAVIISSPNWLHPEQAIACAQAGRHVWIEKPMALTTADADKIVAAVDTAGVQSFVGFSVLFDQAIWKVREMVHAGVVGDLVSLWSRRLACWPLAERKTWRNDYARCGGHISELLAHELHWIIDLAGMPKNVYCRKASRVHDDPRNNEHLWLMLGFAGETTASLEGSQMSSVPDYYRGVVGTAGGLCTGDWGRTLQHFRAKDKMQEITPLQRFDKHAHFLDVIEGKTASIADVHCGRNIVHVSEKAIESAVTGQVVAISA